MLNNSDRALESEATATPAIAEEARLTSRFRTTALCLMTAIGVIEAVFSRHSIQDDGVSYLDMGDAIVRGDWNTAVNGHWSPLYPWLQGLALRLFKPGAYSQFSVVHFVNFLIYLFALGCFDFLLGVAVADRPGAGTAGVASGTKATKVCHFHPEPVYDFARPNEYQLRRFALHVMRGCGFALRIFSDRHNHALFCRQRPNAADCGGGAGGRKSLSASPGRDDQRDRDVYFSAAFFL